MAIIPFNVLEFGARLAYNVLFNYLENIPLPLFKEGESTPFLKNVAVEDISYLSDIDLTMFPIETGQMRSNSYIAKPAVVSFTLLSTTGDELARLDSAMKAGQSFYMIVQESIAITPMMITSISHETLDNTVIKGNTVVTLTELILETRQNNNGKMYPQ